MLDTSCDLTVSHKNSWLRTPEEIQHLRTQAFQHRIYNSHSKTRDAARCLCHYKSSVQV